MATCGVLKIASSVTMATEKLSSLPLAVDEEKEWGILLLNRLATFAYVADPGLAPLATIRGLDWTLKYGKTEMISPIIAVIAMVLAGIFGDVVGGKKFADIAIRYMNSSVESRTLFLCNHFVLHYQIPVHRCIQSMIDGYTVGIRTGDIESALMCDVCLLFTGSATTCWRRAN